jgi:hypothetical protein
LAAYKIDRMYFTHNFFKRKAETKIGKACEYAD